MNITTILTIMAPALIALIAYGIVRFFPPSIDNAFILKAPQWWSRDQQTWDKAYVFLAKKYILYTIILFVFCGAMFFVNWGYAMSLGYILLVFLLLLAQLQVRRYMQDTVK
ncbi:hypothetical protein [Dokdonia sp.]|uniref:hypothetical protein n=1 Tax=Dokdonia sp. TaxID=2024995 RepID=UPI003266E86F